MNSHKVDTLIIGGGVIGLTLANELLSRGKKVTVLEQGAQVGRGCSLANAGWVTPCFAMPLPQPGMFFKSLKWLFDKESPLHIQPHFSLTLARWLFHFMKAMNQKQLEQSVTVLTEISKWSIQSYAELAKRKNIHFDQKGLLMVSGTDDGLKAAIEELHLMKARGIEGRQMSRDELFDFEPILKPIIKGGVFFSQEAHLEPYQTSVVLAEEIEAKGGKILTNTEVYSFEMQGSKIKTVITTQGRFDAELVVLAAGTWSPLMAQQLKLSLPIMGGKGYSMSVYDSQNKPQRPIMIVEKKIAVTPRANAFRLAGTLELVKQDYSISPIRVNAIYKGAQQYLNFQSQQGPLELWRGLRPCTPDGVPMIGPSRKYDNLFYNAGHQMLGLQSAPGSAILAADLIMGKKPNVDEKPFAPSRFE